MNEFWSIMQWPTIASLVMSPVHCLFGLHIVRRGVIFIDLAVAQMAALGTAIAVANHHEIGSPTTYWLSLAFALGTALAIALTRFKLGRVPHEAIIGIIFVVASALAIVVLENTEHGVEELKDILSGSILLADPADVKKTALVYGLIMLTAIAAWRPTAAVSLGEPSAPVGLKRVLVDVLFYGLLAFVVASSVKVAGVLVVFTWLVMPPVCAFFWFAKMKHAILMSIPISFAGTLGGLWLSFKEDWPTGPAIVVVLGAIVALLYFAKLLVPSKEEVAPV
ncbi:MAG: metal ABC transporter permease [Fimbriimonadales bacterium]